MAKAPQFQIRAIQRDITRLLDDIEGVTDAEITDGMSDRTRDFLRLWVRQLCERLGELSSHLAGGRP